MLIKAILEQIYTNYIGIGEGQVSTELLAQVRFKLSHATGEALIDDLIAFLSDGRGRGRGLTRSRGVISVAEDWSPPSLV